MFNNKKNSQSESVHLNNFEMIDLDDHELEAVNGGCCGCGKIKIN